MKPTLSKDGALRYTIRVRHRIGWFDLINLVCHYIVHSDYDDHPVLGELTKKEMDTRGKCLKLLRYKYGTEGPDVFQDWGDDIRSNETQTAIQAIAVAHIDSLFPELKPK